MIFIDLGLNCHKNFKILIRFAIPWLNEYKTWLAGSNFRTKLRERITASGSTTLELLFYKYFEKKIYIAANNEKDTLPFLYQLYKKKSLVFLNPNSIGEGGGYLGHAKQNVVKIARVRTIITLL